MFQDLPRHGFGLLDVRQVCRLDHREARLRDRVADLLRLSHGGRRIFCARDNERGSLNIFEPVPYVGVPEYLAATRVSLRRRAAQHAPRPYDGLGPGSAEL